MSSIPLAAPSAGEPVKNIVLVHGAWVDASGWKGVYEILVKAPGVLSLKRYTRAAGDPDRLPCDIRITNEVLVKLVGDLVDFPFSREAEPGAKA